MHSLQLESRAASGEVNGYVSTKGMQPLAALEGGNLASDMTCLVLVFMAADLGKHYVSLI